MQKLSANAAIAQSVERILGKDEVASSNLASSSKKFQVFGLGIFLSIAKAMVYHQPSGCISSHEVCISSPEVHKAFAMMIYKTAF